MILITVGTQEHKFDRFFNIIDEINFNEEVIIQCGETKYTNSKYKVSPYYDNYLELVKKAKVIITHGGVGSIMEGLEEKKKVIAMVRKEEFLEHVNDHQEEIVNKLVENKNILKFDSVKSLKLALNNTDKLREYKFNNDLFNEKLYDLIENKKN